MTVPPLVRQRRAALFQIRFKTVESQLGLTAAFAATWTLAEGSVGVAQYYHHEAVSMLGDGHEMCFRGGVNGVGAYLGEHKMSSWQVRVFEDVLRERLYQDRQWGHEVDDTQNTPWMWTAYICSYATKWMKDPFKFTREDTDEFYDRMIQTAAIAAAAAESVVRQRDMNGKTFYEPPAPSPPTP